METKIFYKEADVNEDIFGGIDDGLLIRSTYHENGDINKSSPYKKCFDYNIEVGNILFKDGLRSMYLDDASDKGEQEEVTLLQIRSIEGVSVYHPTIENFKSSEENNTSKTIMVYIHEDPRLKTGSTKLEMSGFDDNYVLSVFIYITTKHMDCLWDCKDDVDIINIIINDNSGIKGLYRMYYNYQHDEYSYFGGEYKFLNSVRDISGDFNTELIFGLGSNYNSISEIRIIKSDERESLEDSVDDARNNMSLLRLEMDELRKEIEYNSQETYKSLCEEIGYAREEIATLDTYVNGPCRDSTVSISTSLLEHTESLIWMKILITVSYLFTAYVLFF